MKNKLLIILLFLVTTGVAKADYITDYCFENQSYDFSACISNEKTMLTKSATLISLLEKIAPKIDYRVCIKENTSYSETANCVENIILALYSK